MAGGGIEGYYIVLGSMKYGQIELIERAHFPKERRGAVTAQGRSEAADFTSRYELSSILSTEGPSTQYSRTLVPNTIKGMVFGTRNLKYLVLGPSGEHMASTTPFASGNGLILCLVAHRASCKVLGWSCRMPLGAWQAPHRDTTKEQQ